MTKNPYSMFGGHSSPKAKAWNKGYNQAIKDAIEVIRGADDFNAVRALRKKVE